MDAQPARVAAVDRDTEHCPASQVGMHCVAGTPWGITRSGRGIGDCLLCGQPTITERIALPVPASSPSVGPDCQPWAPCARCRERAS